MKRITRKSWGPVIALLVLALGMWFVSGLPRTFKLRKLSAIPGLLVYADETSASPAYRKWTTFLEASPLPNSWLKFLLQYGEAATSRVVLRSLHPYISAEEVKTLEGLEVVNFLDLQTGPDANLVIEIIVAKATSLRVLHLQGRVTEDGLKQICRGLPDLEDLYLIEATIQEAVPELETGLRKLQGITLENCDLGREFKKNLDARPDVKIAIQ